MNFAKIIFTICLICSFVLQGNAQGGWETWHIRLKDGKTLSTNPLVSADEKTVIYGVGDKYQHENSTAGSFQIEREKIDYIVRLREDALPKELPAGDSSIDLIILEDGETISGKIAQIRSKSLWETIVVINAKEFDARKIAVIKFAAASKPSTAIENKIDAKFRAATIDAVLQLLKDKHAYPEMALKMEEAIRARQRRGEYDSITDGNLLAEKVTADLRAVFDDKHLKLSYSIQPFSAQSSKAGAPSPEEIAAAQADTREFRLAKSRNFKRQHRAH